MLWLRVEEATLPILKYKIGCGEEMPILGGDADGEVRHLVAVGIALDRPAAVRLNRPKLTRNAAERVGPDEGERLLLRRAAVGVDV